MKVYGVEITPEQIAAAERGVMARLPSSCSAIIERWDVEMELDAAGVVKSHLVGWRRAPVRAKAADRLLQKWRREGKIRWTGRHWVRA